MNLSDCIAALQKNNTLPDLIKAAKQSVKPTTIKTERRAVLDALPALFGSSDHKAAVAMRAENPALASRLALIGLIQ